MASKWLAAGAAAAALIAGGCGSSKNAAAPAATQPTATAPSAPSTQAAPTTAPDALPTTSTTTVSAPPPTQAPSPLASIGPATATGTTVSLAKGAQGIFVIGPNGRSLYVFDSDHGTTSACTGSCAAVWPALTSSETTTSGPAINATQLGLAMGQVPKQVTYFGHLLYYFAGDQMPGQTNGITIPGWHLLGPFGNVMLPRS